MAENYVKKFKLLLAVVKKIPIIMAIAQFAMTIIQFFGVVPNWIQIVFGMSISSLIFFYLSSFVFDFCYYHRLPLYYIFASQMLCLYDTYIGLPINTIWLFVIHIMLFLVMVIQLIKFYLK